MATGFYALVIHRNSADACGNCGRAFEDETTTGAHEPMESRLLHFCSQSCALEALRTIRDENAPRVGSRWMSANAYGRIDAAQYTVRNVTDAGVYVTGPESRSPGEPYSLSRFFSLFRAVQP